MIKKGIHPAVKSLNRIGEINKDEKNLVSVEDVENVVLEEVED